MLQPVAPCADLFFMLVDEEEIMHMPDATMEAMEHLKHLCVDIGPRPVGSEMNRWATDYIAEVFAASGLEVERQSFGCPNWQHRQTHLDLDGTVLDAEANTFSPSCDVTAPTVALGTLTELELATVDKQVAILYGELTSDGPLAAQNNPVWCPEKHRRIARLLMDKQPAAVLTVQPKPRNLLPLIEDWDFPIPSATLPAEAGRALLGQRCATVNLRIDSHRSPSQAANVVGRKPGPGKERLVVSAHFDTKHWTPGAIDNGSGAAVLLVLARLLASREVGIGLEFVAFNGEEYHGLGDTKYLGRHGLKPVRFGAEPEPAIGEFGHILAAINLDGIGPKVGVHTAGVLASSQRFKTLVSNVVQRYPAVVWADPGPASNHYTFFTHGVPILNVSSIGVDHVIHLPIDTLEWIDPDKLQEAMALVLEVVEQLHDRPVAWSREQ